MSTFLLGLSEMITLQNILYMLLGTVVGTIFGAIPGLTGSIAISILLPVTFYLDVMPSMANPNIFLNGYFDSPAKRSLRS